MTTPNHLVIVCGHGIWTGGPQNGWDEAEWLIESYKKGETRTFIEHIKAGIQKLGQDSRAILVFSGAPTRPETSLSEARSYANLAAANKYFDCLANHPDASSRIFLEERALDSYYNILFSLIEFWRATSTWPSRTTIISHAFKRARLVDAHCGAIGLLPRVEFVGINPPGIDASAEELERTAKEGRMSADKSGKMADVYTIGRLWAEDPHGVGEQLAGKRRARNFWMVDQRLFRNDSERVQSGVKARMLEDGCEVLAEEATQPWMDVKGCV